MQRENGAATVEGGKVDEKKVTNGCQKMLRSE